MAKAGNPVFTAHVCRFLEVSDSHKRLKKEDYSATYSGVIAVVIENSD